uniref:Mucin-15 n=1 Tax=Salvator merianae TaxID=96440 RepID=A0A8D0B5P4_SALMN
MMTFKGMVFILLLASSPSIQNNGINAVTTSILNSTVINSSPFEKEHNTIASATTAVNFTLRTDLSDNATTTTAAEINNQSSKIFPTSLVSTLVSQTSHKMNHTTETANQPSTNINSISPSSGLPTISSTLPILSESYTATTYISSFKTTSNDFSTVTKNITLTTMGSPNKTEKNDAIANFTDNPLNASTMLLTTGTNNVTIDLQTRSPYSSFTEAREHHKENHSNGAVVFGGIVGAVLGTALICLAGYFICGKRKSNSFAHQRLYDNVRSDPVLRLDSTPEPYGINFGDFSYYNPAIANEALAQSSKGAPCDVIAMDNMTSSQPST